MSSYTKTLAAVALSLVVSLSGCLQGRDVVGPTTGIPEPPPCGTAAAGCLHPGAARFQVRASNCTGYKQVIETPRGVFEPEYPAGIQNFGPVIDWTEMNNWVCDQALVGGAVVNGFELAYLISVIPNPDEYERNATTHGFMLELYSNSPSLIENGTRQFGLQIQPAGALQVSTGPAQNGYELVEYVYPPGTDNYRLRGFMEHEPDGSYEAQAATYYANNSRLARLFVQIDGKWDFGNHAEVEFGPDSYWGRHSEVMAWRGGFNHYQDVSLEIWFDASYAPE